MVGTYHITSGGTNGWTDKSDVDEDNIPSARKADGFEIGCFLSEQLKN